MLDMLRLELGISYGVPAAPKCKRPWGNKVEAAYVLGCISYLVMRKLQGQIRGGAAGDFGGDFGGGSSADTN